MSARYRPTSAGALPDLRVGVVGSASPAAPRSRCSPRSRVSQFVALAGRNSRASTSWPRAAGCRTVPRLGGPRRARRPRHRLVGVPNHLTADRHRGAAAAASTCSARSRSRDRRTRRRWSMPRARQDRVLEVAFNHRRRADVQYLHALPRRAGRSGGSTTRAPSWRPRQGIPGIGSWFTNRGGGRRGRWSTSAPTCSTSRCSSWGSRA